MNFLIQKKKKNINDNFFSNKNNKKPFKLENKNQNNIYLLDSLKENEEEYDD